MTLDVGDYPSSHHYLLCTTSQQVPSAISSALLTIGTFEGIRVLQMLSQVTKILDEANNPNKMVLCMSGEDEMDGTQGTLTDDEPSDNESLGGWSPQSPRHQTFLVDGATPVPSGSFFSTRALNSRIRQDLRLAKAAGFRVSHLGSLVEQSQESFVMISCRIAKLGISEEALQAWHLAPNQYFILVIRYTTGYRPLENLTADEAWGQKTVKLRVGVSHNYKIGSHDAIRAFSETKDKAIVEDGLVPESARSTTSLNPFFIGRPLNELLNDRLTRLLKYRLDRGFSWQGAEQFYNDHQGSRHADFDSVAPQHKGDDASRFNTLPDLMTADHLTQKATPFSFPLLAMQFALRHLVRCTEFCLVCHCKVEDDFEALKPYVCSKPLCLYQYIKLGFGPSIEHEIISQPHVVDLLISFCYSSASARKLGSLPTGMGLLVPSLTLMPTILTDPIYSGYYAYPTLPTTPQYSSVKVGGSASVVQDRSNPLMPVVEPVIYTARLDRLSKELLFPPKDRTLRVGQWIFISLPGPSKERWHCRVIEALHPTVRLGTPIISYGSVHLDDPVAPKGVSLKPQSARDGTNNPIQQPTGGRPEVRPTLNPTNSSSADPATSIEVQLIVYEQNFDDLPDAQKQRAICVLLETLPSVKEMKTYLQSNNGKNTSLQTWADRISPAALGVLRWIIASNRSCIIQVDNVEGDNRKNEERVSGMEEWMQFRFAQGAPDKEQRFVTSVRDTSQHLKYPTLFAWHGSPLPNWHGILREGLHFRDSTHGRSFGDGVYHALDAKYSLQYTAPSRYPGSGDRAVGEWPYSGLRISEALALNEIVNAPEKFVSRRPHLVVAQLDWIQARYLFVKCMSELKIEDNPPTEVYEQDPTWNPLGSKSQKIKIPLTAVSKSRRPTSNITRLGNKRMRTGRKNAESEVDDGIVLSDDTDIEDIEILISEDEDTFSQANSALETSNTATVPRKSAQEPARTDFVPGTLDHSLLPLLQAPSYATSMATRSLQRELANTLQVQELHPAHELGWYIDPNLVTNVYQWIVELHSFEAHLPLADDMKAKDLASVVLELRFGKDYPMSPPFVRVIRPRFLSFMAGGGGHVTAGGALCMELLTNSGWSAVSNIESVLLQVRLAISSTDPKPARLEPGPIREYGVNEAVQAFVRACQTHGVSYKGS